MAKRLVMVAMLMALSCSIVAAFDFDFGFNLGGKGGGIQWVDLLPSLAWVPDTAIDFGEHDTGTVTAANVSITNSGNDIAEDVAVTTSAPFSIYSTVTFGNISSGKNRIVKLRFSPMGAGVSNGFVNYSAPNIAKISLPLSGTGVSVEPILSLDTATLAFGNVSSTSNRSQTFRITNSGFRNLSTTTVTGSGTDIAKFTNWSTCKDQVIAVNGYCDTTVTFTPGAAGDFTASLSIASNALSTPDVVALSGAGVVTGVPERIVTVKPSGGTYTSLNAALTAESGDLVALDRRLTIECYAMSDTTAADTGTGYTTDATHYIKITTPTSERHDGKWNTAKYRLEVSAGKSMVIRVPNIWVDGLQISSTSDITIWQGAAGSFWLSNSIIKGNSTYTGVENTNASSATYVWNTVVMDAYSGIKRDMGTMYVYNSTVTGGWVPIYAPTVVKNSYAGGGSHADFAVFSAGTMVTTATDNTSGSAGLTGIALNTTNFTNVTAGSQDYHLPLGSALIGVGTNTSGDAAPMNFTTDIDGGARGATWSIGADQR